VYSRDFVQLTLQTDTVKNIPCGTSTGVIIWFDSIDVVNQLDKEKAHATIKRFGVNYDRTFVFDKIAHEINQFCSQATLHEVYISKFSTLDESLAEALQTTCNKFDTGLTVVAIRVTKPRIPDSVRLNYENVEKATSELQGKKKEKKRRD
jgi:regulator of protease activity HflC (stomatin/prohibitin superfamily)